MRSRAYWRIVWGVGVGLVTITIAAGCASKKPPLARPAPPPLAGGDQTPSAPPSPSAPRAIDTPALRPEPAVSEDPMLSRSVDELNRESPLRPAFFDYDSAELTADARAALDADADALKRYPSWVVTIEGHCDDRGTAEYNLALGERRAVAAQSYLVSLGVSSARLRTVSYGKEFPFDPGSNEAAWAKNRRAHFVITAK